MILLRGPKLPGSANVALDVVPPSLPSELSDEDQERLVKEMRQARQRERAELERRLENEDYFVRLARYRRERKEREERELMAALTRKPLMVSIGARGPGWEEGYPDRGNAQQAAAQRVELVNAGQGYASAPLIGFGGLSTQDRARSTQLVRRATPFSCAAGSQQYREPDIPPTDSKTPDAEIPREQSRQLDLTDEAL